MKSMANKEEIIRSLKEDLRKKGYGIVGRHSAVKPCLWTKKSILDEGVCYKQVFYGIESHRCLQMSPAAYYCTQRCIFCWRPQYFTARDFDEIDDPEFIIEESIKLHRKLLVGFKGNPKANLRKWEESRNPKHVAISLIGEPTLYPRLGELIEYAHKKGMTTFLVSNGTMPEVIENLDPLPTQLYITVAATNKEMHEKVCRPLIPDSWERLMETLSLFPSLKTRKVIRLTLVKGLNMEDVEGYAKIIEKYEPDFVEPKAFMLVGSARERLKIENMPRHEDIMNFARKLAELTSYELVAEKAESRVALLMKEEVKRFINT